MELSEILNLRSGIIAVIGSGGKTTLLEKAGKQLARNSRVLLCTSTKIFPFPDIPLGRSREELEQLCFTGNLICGGIPISDSGKLGPLLCPLAGLTALFDFILVEADGAAGRPMKAHAEWEPVIPPEADRVITVMGASGFGKPVAEAAHRPERFAELAKVPVDVPITPELAAAVIRAEHLGDTVFVNQVEEIEQLAWVSRFADAAQCPVFAGSLQKGAYFSCGL